MRAWLSRSSSHWIYRPQSALYCHKNRHTWSKVSVAETLKLSTSVQDPPSVQINGFVRSVRKQKSITFAAVNDGSSLESLQTVLQPQHAPNVSVGAAVTIKGRWVPSRNGQQQAAELQAVEVRQVGEHDATVGAHHETTDTVVN